MGVGVNDSQQCNEEKFSRVIEVEQEWGGCVRARAPLDRILGKGLLIKRYLNRDLKEVGE